MTQIPEWANWLARDKGGSVWAYEEKPEKYHIAEYWGVEKVGGRSSLLDKDCSLPFIIWEDEEPMQVIHRGKGRPAFVRFHKLAKPLTIHTQSGGLYNYDLEKLRQSQAHGFDEPPTMDMVSQPNHYIGKYGLEVETVLQNFLPFYSDSYTAHRIASAVEYLLRSPRKNGLEDIKKARENLSQIIEYIEQEEQEGAD